MDIKEAITRHLLGGNLSADNIHYTSAPVEEPPPYGVVSVISTVRQRTHQGQGRLTQSRIQIDWFSHTDTENEKLFRETHNLLKVVNNEVIGGAGGLFVAQFILDDESDDYEPDTGLYHKIMDYLVQFEEE
jgi:hypothetical protein